MTCTGDIDIYAHICTSSSAAERMTNNEEIAYLDMLRDLITKGDER
jgi:hypothetical protein